MCIVGIKRRKGIIIVVIATSVVIVQIIQLCVVVTENENGNGYLFINPVMLNEIDRIETSAYLVQSYSKLFIAGPPSNTRDDRVS